MLFFLEDYDKAYVDFKKFIYFDDEGLDYLLQGCYLFASITLTQEDNCILLERYNRLIDNYNNKSDIENMCETKLELAMCYYFLSERYESRDYYDKGKKILDELSIKYLGIYNTKRDEDIRRLNEMYKDLDKKFK